MLWRLELRNDSIDSLLSWVDNYNAAWHLCNSKVLAIEWWGSCILITAIFWLIWKSSTQKLVWKTDFLHRSKLLSSIVTHTISSCIVDKNYLLFLLSVSSLLRLWVDLISIQNDNLIAAILIITYCLLGQGRYENWFLSSFRCRLKDNVLTL